MPYPQIDDEEGNDALTQLKALMTGTPYGSPPPAQPFSVAPPQPAPTPAPPAAPPPSYGDSSGPMGMFSKMAMGAAPDMSGLEAAQGQARTDKIKALMLRAAGTIGNAIGQPVGRNVQRLPLDSQGYDQLEANADQPVQFEQQKNQRYQELLNRANQMRTAQLAQTREDREAGNAQSLEAHRLRLEELMAQRANQPSYGTATLGGQGYEVEHKSGQLTPVGAPKPQGQGGAVGGLKPKQVEDEFGKLADAISTYRGRGNLNRENQQALQNAERLESLIKLPSGTIANLNPNQVREAATALAGLISRGGPQSVSQIEELVPSTLAGRFAKAKQYLLNAPQGAEAQEFLQNMLDTASREARTIHGQIRRGQLQAIPNFAHLREKDPQRYESILRGAGIDPASLDEHGLERVAGGGGQQRITRTDPQTGETRYWNGSAWVKG